MDSRLRYLNYPRSWILLCICDLYACMNLNFRPTTYISPFLIFIICHAIFSVYVITRQKKIKILSKDTKTLNLNTSVYEYKDEQITSFSSQ